MLNYPNTFPFPNEIINGWNARLKGSELKILLVIVRKTLGWIADPQTGMRKEEDWISYKQLLKLTGLSTKPVSDAIDALVKYKLIQVRNKKGELLDTKDKRRYAGRRKDAFIYRLNLIALKSKVASNTSSTALKSKVHCFKKSSSTALKSKDYKRNLLQNKLLQKNINTIKEKKISKISSINGNVIREIAEKYQVPVVFVEVVLDRMENWCAAKGKTYKDYRRALMNWVSKSKEESLKERGRNDKYRSIDATKILRRMDS